MNRTRPSFLWSSLALAGMLVFSFPALCEAASRQGGVRILHVERIEAAGSGRVGLEPVRMSKFVRERTDQARLTYVVGWDAGAGVPVGTLVTFEYRQEEGGNVKFLAHKCKEPLQGEQESFFVLPEGSRVLAWRTRVVYGGRRKAERVSSLWR